MQDKHLYEYAIIRIVPRVEREEFINCGIILFCKKENYLKCKFGINQNRLIALFPDSDIDLIQSHLKSFENIAAGLEIGGPVALFDPPSRFRWLTAPRSTIIQTSKVHPGLGDDNENVIKKLFNSFVLD